MSTSCLCPDSKHPALKQRDRRLSCESPERNSGMTNMLPWLTIQLQTTKRLHSNPNHQVWPAQSEGRWGRGCSLQLTSLLSAPRGGSMIDSSYHFRTFSENVERQCFLGQEFSCCHLRFQVITMSFSSQSSPLSVRTDCH